MVEKIYDLSVPVGVKSPHWPHLGITSDAVIQRVLSHEIPLLPGVTRTVCIVDGSTIGHVGTHPDLPSARVEGGLNVDTFPLESCYGTGVVVDFRYMKKWDRITAEDFDKATPKIEPGDFVVCNTGWHKEWATYAYWHYYPGLVPSGAEWLIKKKVKAIAGTWATSDHSLAFAPLETTMPWLLNDYKRETGKDPNEEFPEFEPCLTMLLESGISCIQNAGGDIDQVTGKRCKFFALPCRLMEADASMVRLVAIVEEQVWKEDF